MTKKRPKVDQPTAFNPLAKKNLGESVAEALLREPVYPLPPHRFIGAGVYTLYYIGDFPLYSEIGRRNRDERFGWPIYVGKAVPAGARKGGFGLDIDPGQVLYRRLCEHAASIDEVQNLALSDFRCRFLVVDDIWIPLGENLLIETFSPVWNRKIDGFGNHDPGSGRYNQQRSAWDIVHPGRPWAERLPIPETDQSSVMEEAGVYIVGAARRLDVAQQEDRRGR